MKILLNDKLKNILNGNNYTPAYGGESVGLDLYNTGPEIIFPPCGTLIADLFLSNDYDEAFETRLQTDSIENPIEWIDLPQTLRDNCSRKLIPTGVRISLQPNQVGLILERGSIIKTPLKVRAGVIDPGYTGEIFVNAINFSDVPTRLEAGAKTPFQLVVVTANNNFETVDEAAFNEIIATAKRQFGKVGSSN